MTRSSSPRPRPWCWDYRTGELKAIVGGRTQPTRRKTLNRASDMNMPVGLVHQAHLGVRPGH